MLGRISSSEITEWVAYFKIKNDDAEKKMHQQKTLNRLKTRRPKGKPKWN